MAKAQITSIDDSHPVDAAAASEAGASVAKPSVTGTDAELSGKTSVINIHPSEGNTEPVFLQINGYGYQVPRGKPVEVPVELVEILQNAQQSTFRPEGRGYVESVTHRFAFSVIR